VGKKWIVWILVGLLFLGLGVPLPPAQAAATSVELWVGKNEITVDGRSQSIDAPPFLQDDRLLIPIRFVCEALGANVQWIQATKAVVIRFADHTIELAVGTMTATVDGIAKTLEVSPQLIGFRTFVPLRFLSEEVGAQVSWDADQQKVTVSGSFSPFVAPPLNLSILWHQHQPLYYKDPQTGLYTKPWVRLHATKDYLNMLQILEQYPKIHATFNLTPSLLKQLDDLAGGAMDTAYALTQKPTAKLTAEEKATILRRFFDANWSKVIPLFPRYQALLNKRGTDVSDASIEKAVASFSEQDLRDLTVLFNLAWIAPQYRAKTPLDALVKKGKEFTEADKKVVLDEGMKLLRQVVPEHKKAQDAGQIEITMTPYTHPILPLLYDTNLAKVAMPDVSLPTRFSYPLDAIAQIQKGVDFYQQHFGRKPVGMWPAEGSVAQEIVKMVYDGGIQWMASDEEVLAKSIGLGSFARDATDLVQLPELLYQPWKVSYAEDSVYMVFRDRTLSDLVGFRYSGTPGDEAAQDMINRLHTIRQALLEADPANPHLVTVLLDGENAWEYYDNNGEQFLHSLYQKLSEDPQIVTVTPAEYIKQHPEAPTAKPLWAGSWINADFSTWIGDEEENRAWEALLTTRQAVDEAFASGKFDAKKQSEIMENVFAAEGSDWFWWYGPDQDSGDDASFDQSFRNYLGDIYTQLGLVKPDFVYVPIVAQPIAKPTRQVSGDLAPVIDGVIEDKEWAAAGLYEDPQGSGPFRALFYGLDPRNLYLSASFRQPLSSLGKDLSLSFYFSVPAAKGGIPFSRNGATGEIRNLLGFYASYELRLEQQGGAWKNTLSIAGSDGKWSPTGKSAEVVVGNQDVEMKLPFSLLASPQDVAKGEFKPLEMGDIVLGRAVLASASKDLQDFPSTPFQIMVPDTGTTQAVLSLDDPADDDHGPGSYIYPADPVFYKGSFDMTHFTVAQDDNNVIFKVKFAGPIENPWNSPIGLSLQTIDIYIRQPELSRAGDTLLLPGRNARFPSDKPWHWAIWVEGWQQGLYMGTEGAPPQKVAVDLKVAVDAAGGTVTIKVPKKNLGDNPAGWEYACTICSQEGYPSPGVWRVREVKANAEQWRIGGGIDGWTDPAILDLAWSAGALPTQEEMLSSYKPQDGPLASVDPLNFAQIGWLEP
jgi:alpha-amylase/alpha-mannosidase (GH57 family)